nr:8975_t:CDS:2 [Entrophospora candida]
MDNCPKCNIKNKYPYCCHLCLPSYFQDEFSNWSSGNQTIDKYIQGIQLDATEWCQYLEWIPYERLVNVHYLAKGGYGKVYSAIWLDGPKTFDRDKIEIFSRKENHPVALKSINQLGLNMEEWFSEARTDRDVRFTLNDGLERSKIDEAKNNPLTIPARILVRIQINECHVNIDVDYVSKLYEIWVAEICHQAEALSNTQDFFYLRITKHVFTRNGTFEICELVDPGHHLPTAIRVL